MKKNNVALWGTGFVGAFICILVDSNYATTVNGGIGWLGLAGGVIALICAYLFFNDAFKVLMNEADKENQKQLEAQREVEKEAKEERKRQERLEKKLDELILVQKAVYTILKKESEINEAGYERIENQMIEISDRLLNHEKTMVKTLVKYNRDDIQGATKALSKTLEEEIVKVQNTGNDLQNIVLDLAKEMKAEIQNQTEEMSKKLNGLENSVQNMNISVATPIVTAIETAEEENAMEAAVSLEDILEQETLEQEVEEENFVLEEDETLVADEVDSLLETLSDTTEIQIPEPEVVAPPVIEDPNRAMTPDEIAALIASMDGGASEPEPEPVIEEPEVVAPPVIEDPNRAMTPDEIAALIASMS